MNGSPHVTGADFSGRRVNRHHPAGDQRLQITCEQVDGRAVHLPSSLTRFELAADGGFGALFQLIGSKRLVEPNAADTSGLIRDFHLDDREVSPGPAKRHLSHPSDHRDFLTAREFTDRRDGAAVEVPARRMEQQVGNRDDSGLSQGLTTFPRQALDLIDGDRVQIGKTAATHSTER